MKLKLLLASFFLINLSLFSQDTTWVQTFTFDSISTRRAEFNFPLELQDKRFEKVLMYYKLKCDPQTPWDSYACGEWDYLAYTRIFDHTGIMDSVKIDSVRYMNNFNSPINYTYDNWGYSYADTYILNEKYRDGFTTSLSSINQLSTGNSSAPFDLTNKGGRFQMLVKASELMSAGVIAGDIQSLALYVNNINVNGELLYPSISIKPTSDSSIIAFHTTGFTEVYNLSRSILGSTSELSIGENELEFYQPFYWNGIDNIIIDFNFQRSMPALNNISFLKETSLSNMAVNFPSKNGVLNFSGSNYASLELSDFDMGDDITIAFWAKGNGNNGINTSILEAIDTNNTRIINIHMPWSNNNLYWDCGEGVGYDRIYSSMIANEIDNDWHHWAFVKDQSSGEMKIFKDGSLWLSGSGLTRSVGMMHRLILGSNKNRTNNWKGSIDEFQIYSAPVDQATIQNWYKKKIDNTHPNWSDLLVYYDFDNEEWAKDMSQNDFLLMPSEQGMFDFSYIPLAGVIESDRPIISFGQGSVTGQISNKTIPYYKLKEPEVVFEYESVNRHFAISNAFIALPSGNEVVYDSSNTVVSITPFIGSNVLSNEVITYYQEPFEIIHDVEIGRFITPYGIQFDLGPNGFTWIYDVTDYQMYFKDLVDLAAHNTQELIDLKFAFIEGIPPRDVHSRKPIWSDFRSYSYSSLDNDLNLQSTSVTLPDTSSMFKIKTRLTGHGHHGSVNCCEWDSKDHMISVNGIERFNWEIWEETACGDNPNISQGGTWPYAREGWCPGDLVKEYDHELTPYVTPGTSVSFDYDIEDIPFGDEAQGNGNYVVAMDLISYSSPNFQHDAAIIDVLNPNSWEYYRKWNPSCSNPRVILQNTGEQELTSCTIRIWISYGDFIDYEWNGNLKFLEKEIVEIPIEDDSWWADYTGQQTFRALVMNVQGTPGMDEYPNNNEVAKSFEAPTYISGPFLVWFTTNNKAMENNWRLEDADGNIIFERGNLNALANNTNYKDTFDLAPGCYSITLEDTDSDGIGFWYSAQVEGETNGTFRIKNVGGPIVKTLERDFGNYIKFNFSVGYALDIDEKDKIGSISIFPNPNSGLFYVDFKGDFLDNVQLEIFDLMGRRIVSEKMDVKANFSTSLIDLSKSPDGHYIVKVKTDNGIYIEELIKQ
ncbi:MAG: hypothetical protein CL844_06345 [Crocinitomicaceae bacterium]|nr:hypothetical protein [Crocinitomicaceae bacterium]|tara:strand:+ start:19557 stop:23036 length:3480 start_codon:yes stop_codon:yes gene_type:complete